MKSWTFLVCLALASIVGADEAIQRFNVVPSTVTKTETTTSVTKVKSTTICYTTIAALNACRKRRGMEENFEMVGLSADFAPSAVLAVEPSRPARLFSVGGNPPIVEVPALQGSQDMVEVRIAGLNNVCAARLGSPLFPNLSSLLTLNVLTTVTSTMTAVSTSYTETVKNPFTLVGCKPPGLTFSAC